MYMVLYNGQYYGLFESSIEARMWIQTQEPAEGTVIFPVKSPN